MVSHKLLVPKRTSSKFPDRLRAVLGGQEFDEFISRLQTDELEKFIDYLDEVRSLCWFWLPPTEPAVGLRWSGPRQQHVQADPSKAAGNMHIPHVLTVITHSFNRQTRHQQEIVCLRRILRRV